VDRLKVFLRFICGILIGIVDLALVWAFVLECAEVRWGKAPYIFFLSGMGAFFLLNLFFKKKAFLYVFAHELSHAIAALLTGGKVHSIYVAGQSGNTTMDKTNTFVLLFPYIFPFYTVCVLLFYWILGLVGNVDHLQNYYYGALGMTLCHHLFHTIYSIYEGQDDIRKSGTLFALSAVLFANLCFIAILFTYHFKTFSWQDATTNAWQYCQTLF